MLLAPIVLLVIFATLVFAFAPPPLPGLGGFVRLVTSKKKTGLSVDAADVVAEVGPDKESIYITAFVDRILTRTNQKSRVYLEFSGWEISVDLDTATAISRFPVKKYVRFKLED